MIEEPLYEVKCYNEYVHIKGWVDSDTFIALLKMFSFQGFTRLSSDETGFKIVRKNEET